MEVYYFYKCSNLDARRVSKDYLLVLLLCSASPHKSTIQRETALLSSRNVAQFGLLPAAVVSMSCGLSLFGCSNMQFTYATRNKSQVRAPETLHPLLPTVSVQHVCNMRVNS